MRRYQPPSPHPSGARPPDLPREVVPNHVAIIMDGNGRWAKARGLPRIEGHKRGEGALTKIYADVYVERQSQKAIVIGARGSRLKEVGTKARQAIEELLGTKVYLDLHVRVAKDWQRDPKQLRKLGF